MAKLTPAELIEAFKELSLIELSDFVKLFEAAGGDAAAAEEKDSFDVVLESAGDKKIGVIKVVRGLTSLGLKEAKELVDGAPSTVLEGAAKDAAEKAKAELEEAGATVTLK